MDWNLKAPSWDLSEVDQTTLPNIETVDGSSRFGVYRTKGEFSVDLKLGHVGNSGTEPVLNTSNNKLKDAVSGAVGVSKIAASPSGSSKRARAINNGNQTVSCLVDGCNSDLSTCRDYHRRHKVCELHSKTAQVTIGGQKQRFCQQCSRFHSLEEFDEGKRSCRKRLDGHNRRRRKPQPEPITRSGSFLSNYQGTQLLPFTSSHAFPSSAMVNPGWSGDVRLQQMHMIDKQDLFLGSSPSSYSNNKEGKQQLAFLQQGDSNNTVLNNQSHHHHLQAADNSSVCHHHNNAITRNSTFTESGGLRCKMFCGTTSSSSSLTSSIHDYSSCALSLLSSPLPQTHNNHPPNNNNNNNNGSLNHMALHPHHHSSSLMQPLGLSLHDSSMEQVDTVLGPSGGSDHCSSLYNMDSHHGSQANDAHPQLFPFQWE